ncbi:MAG: hypothetical protein JW940_19030 [Polyangiaceae bacterium]|nr:hypothetical protein [Polyangiaceae bacterium]
MTAQAAALPLTLPRIREDLRITSQVGALVIEDAVQRKAISVGPECAAVLDVLAREGATPSSVRAALPGADPVRLWQHIVFLVHEHVLDSPRWRAQRVLYENAAHSYPTAKQLELRCHPALGHQCVACGSSCQGTDVRAVARQ